MHTPYYKFIGAIAGNLVAIAVLYLSTRGLAVCVIPGNEATCTIMGFSTAQVTGAVMTVLNSAFVYFAPANQPVTPTTGASS